jgi:ankyrin repeat protein
VLCFSTLILLFLSPGVLCAEDLDKGFAEAVAAGDIPKLRILLDQGASINAKNKEGETALMVAALEGRTDMVRFLIDRGADLNARDVVGATPLLYAALGGSLDTIQLLVEKGADLNAKTLDGQTALSISRVRGNNKVAEFLERVPTRK